MKKKIGILGGAFNPITLGHVSIAELVIENHGLDEVWFLPSANHPNGKIPIPFSTRFEMISDVVSDKNKLYVKGYETLNETGYTYDLMDIIEKHNPGHDYFFIVGSDRNPTIEKWYKFEQLLERLTIISVDRSQSNISSSAVRRLVREHASHKTLLRYVDDTTLKRIDEYGLYQIKNEKNLR
jgi:nicotinate-nucleotide adenylyltransferase